MTNPIDFGPWRYNPPPQNRKKILIINNLENGRYPNPWTPPLFCYIYYYIVFVPHLPRKRGNIEFIFPSFRIRFCILTRVFLTRCIQMEGKQKIVLILRSSQTHIHVPLIIYYTDSYSIYFLIHDDKASWMESSWWVIPIPSNLKPYWQGNFPETNLF